MRDKKLEKLREAYTKLNEQNVSTTIEAGRLYAGQIRKLLTKVAADYPTEFRWKEDKAFLDSTFFISGDIAVVKTVVNYIKRQLGEG